MIFRAFTFALRPSAEQMVHLDQFAGVCRLVWNLALEQRVNHWRQFQSATGDNLNYVTQARQLKDLRAEFDWIAAVSQTAQARVLKNLDAAFQRFFKGHGGFPKFKRKGTHDSFSFAGREIIVERMNRRWGRVRVPKIGWIRFRWTRAVQGSIREATVSRTALGWHISIGCLVDGDVSDNDVAVGVDRGVAVPMMLSDGTSYCLPANISALERKHRKAQRIASHRKKGSNRWRKAVKRAAAIKAKQARVRKHWAHETTTDIARRFGTVVVEKLRTSVMTKSAKGTLAEPGRNVGAKTGLNRSILNIGWHQIETMLAYKAANLIKVNPAYTSQTCASCGTVDIRSRKSQASFVCTACGHRDNADRNAAINILNRGNTPGVEAAGCGADEARTVQVVSPLGNLPASAGERC
jgi:putative transposase